MAKAVPTSAMAQVEEGAAEIESIEQSMGALTTITEQSEGISGLSAGMGSKVRQWLHSAAKEISKSSLAWYLDMDVEEDRLTSFPEVVLVVVDNIREEKRMAVVERKRQEVERVKEEARKEERARVAAEEKIRVEEARVKAEEEARVQQEAEQKAAREKRKRAEAKERKRRKQIEREWRARRKQELVDISASKALVRQMREQERLRFLALKAAKLQHFQDQLKGGQFYDRERSWGSAPRKPDAGRARNLPSRRLKSRLHLPSISKAESKPKQLLNGPRATTAKPRKKKGSVVQSMINLLGDLDKRLTDPFPHVPSASPKLNSALTQLNSASAQLNSALSQYNSTALTQLNSSISSASELDSNPNPNPYISAPSPHANPYTSAPSPHTNPYTLAPSPHANPYPSSPSRRLRISTTARRSRRAQKPPASPITVPVTRGVELSPLRVKKKTRARAKKRKSKRNPKKKSSSNIK